MRTPEYSFFQIKSLIKQCLLLLSGLRVSAGAAAQKKTKTFDFTRQFFQICNPSDWVLQNWFILANFFQAFSLPRFKRFASHSKGNPAIMTSSQLSQSDLALGSLNNQLRQNEATAGRSSVQPSPPHSLRPRFPFKTTNHIPRRDPRK